MLSSVLSFEKSRAESAYPTSTDIVSSMKLKISLIGVRNDDMASCAARSDGERRSWIEAGMITDSVTVAIIPMKTTITNAMPYQRGLPCIIN